jgi:hypothetical protein
MTDNDEGKYVADTIQEQKLRNHYYNKILPFFTAPMHKAVLMKKASAHGNCLTELWRH